MLGYFAIYSNNGSGWFRNSDASSKQHRSIFGILPHEIAVLNAQWAAGDPAIRKTRPTRLTFSKAPQNFADAPGLRP